MFRSYLKVFFRNIQRYKIYSFINVTGLAIGMACCILIVVYIINELSYDRYHEKTNQIYRVGVYMDLGGRSLRAAISNHPVGHFLRREYPEVLDAVRFRRYLYRTLVEYEEARFFEENIFFADDSVFNVFSFPMVKGDPKSALVNPFSIVVTEDMAKKYFGEKDPVGKVIRLDNHSDFTVTGVMKNIPRNSHFTFDMLCSFETFYVNNQGQREKWLGDLDNYTYLLLRDNFDPRQLEQKFPAIVDKHLGPILKALGGEFEFFLQPLTSIHLYSNLEGEISGNSDIAYVYIFAAIAGFILLIACINFMNLSTARSANRAKEVGMRKVLGAHKKKLIIQFLGESLFYSFISLIIAFVFVELALPLFQSLSGRELSSNYAQLPWLILGFIGLTFFVGLSAGSYPALILSSFKPANILKGSLRTGAADSRFRSVLVVVQFSISIVLIVGTVVIFSQINYMKNRRLGFDKEHIVILPILDGSIRRSIDTIKEELKRQAGISIVSVSSHVPSHGTRHQAFLPEGYTLDQSQMMGAVSIDHDYIPTMGIDIIAGRNFSPEFSTDSGRSILINEAAVRKFGWDDPLGKTIVELTGNGIKKTVIGVVRDFHMVSLRNVIEPLYIENDSNRFGYVSIRLQPGNIPRTMGLLENKWKEIDPTRTFDYSFLDESFDSQYRAEESLSRIFTNFSLLAIIIACLGLFGLTSFLVEQRTKEIGIRKVLGASVSDIALLLSREFFKWLLVANIIAWPVAYYAMNKWLQSFAYRITLGPGVFFLAALMALLIAVFTVSYQSIKAALANPISALRYE